MKRASAQLTPHLSSNSVDVFILNVFDLLLSYSVIHFYELSRLLANMHISIKVCFYLLSIIYVSIAGHQFTLIEDEEFHLDFSSNVGVER